jgi:hypothetical protein
MTGGAPALVSHEVGRGRVVVLTSPLDGSWNDLVLHPGFVPLSHQLVRWASGREAAPAWRTVGDLLAVGELLAGPAGEAAGEDGDADRADPETDRAEPGTDRPDPGTDRPVALTPSDTPVPVDAGTLLPLRERGFYEVRDPRADAAVVVAVNGDPAESEPAPLDPEIVASAISGGPAAPMTARFAPEDRERRQSLWWYFLAGAFVVMALETLVSNGLSRRPLPRTAED